MRTHGIAATYSSGCRCADCRDAWTAYYRERGYGRARRARLVEQGLTTNGTPRKRPSKEEAR